MVDDTRLPIRAGSVAVHPGPRGTAGCDIWLTACDQAPAHLATAAVRRGLQESEEPYRLFRRQVRQGLPIGSLRYLARGGRHSKGTKGGLYRIAGWIRTAKRRIVSTSRRLRGGASRSIGTRAIGGVEITGCQGCRPAYNAVRGGVSVIEQRGHWRGDPASYVASTSAAPIGSARTTIWSVPHAGL